MIAVRPVIDDHCGAEMFFAPPYAGSRGWVGIWLDGDFDWSRVAAALRDADPAEAPKRLPAQRAETGK